MYRLAILLVGVLPIALATEGWRPCPGVPAPHWVNITNCDKAPCILPRGSDMSMTSLFTSNEYSETLSTYTDFLELDSGIAGNFPLPSAQKNTCGRLVRASCPIYPDEDIQYELKMPVLLIYPKNFDLDLTIYVKNENGNMETCFMITGRTSG